MGYIMRKSIFFHATSPELLQKKNRQLLEALCSPEGDRSYANLATPDEECPTASSRVGFVWETREEALVSLNGFAQFLASRDETPEKWQDSTGVYRRHGITPGVQKLAGIFSGQGAQYPGMGRQLYEQFPFIRQDLDRMDRLMENQGLIPISQILFPPGHMDAGEKHFIESLIHFTQYTQPALGVFTSGLFRVVQRLGFKPDFIAGLSFGEVLGLWASKAIQDHSLLEVILSRGIAMALEDAAGTGTMMAVTGNRVRELAERIKTLPEVFVESWNSHDQLVLSGHRTRLEDLQYTLQDEGYSAFILLVSGPFHSPFMETARKKFAIDLAREIFHAPVLPVYSNLTARPYPKNPDIIREMLITHLVKPVRFSEMIENIHRDGGFTFVELGPKRTVTPLIQNILKGKPHETVALNTGNRKRTQHRLPSPVSLMAFFKDHPPVPCVTRNISQDGLRLEGLPRNLAGLQFLDIQIMGMEDRVKGKILWRQARHAGVKLIHTPWTEEFFNTMIRDFPPDPDSGPDKDHDRQLRDAVMRLIVLGYPLNKRGREFLSKKIFKNSI